MQSVVDVSYHNGTIDWNKVKKSGTHAIIRCGYIRNGKWVKDAQWERNADECKRLGIPFGAYLYSYATTPTQAFEEAVWAVELCKPYREAMAYPLFFDSEQKGTEKIAPTAVVIFCNHVKNEGFTPGVYANQSWWQDHLKNISRDYVRWVARWSENEPVVGWKIWQYTNAGTCPGVPATSEGGCDMSWSVMDVTAPVPSTWKTPDELANEVQEGKHGNGSAREKSLGDRYNVVQAIVSYRLAEHSLSTKQRLTTVANEVIKGKYGNGEERKRQLGSIYEPVQQIVNQKLKK